ncbi:MAG: 2-polyprenyl-3-methyl-6-methoxy-1,4-benzoquinone monooxygenase [Legionellales bacterium]|nr:2-polyprenyl-3-methyl-6-methoxy-1,4-benzoquinone monooxygenase [Legionellales bacterium]
MSHQSFIDRIILRVDSALRTLTANYPASQRSCPDQAIAEKELTDSERKLSKALMRVNHAGEVSAQALYQGQALTARDPEIQQALMQSAQEENEHLHWCENRLQALNGRTSYLNPLWYLGSFGLGMVAGLAGDKWSLGFLAETEKQVVEHLEHHLETIASADEKSRAILQQMQEDEAHHASVALTYGAEELPLIIKDVMRVMSKIMTTTAYWI